MTPEKALEILDQAAAAASSNRGGHATLIEAVRTIHELIQSTKAKPELPSNG